MLIALSLFITTAGASDDFSPQRSACGGPCGSVTLTLRSAVTTALARSPAVLAAREKARESGEGIGLAVSQFLPSASANALAQYRKDPITNPYALFGGEPYNSYSVGFQLAQPIFAGGALTGGLRYAKSAEALSELDIAVSERDLASSVIEAFYAVLLNQRNVDTYKRNIEVQSALLAATQRRQRIGRSQLLDVLQLKTQLALLQPKLTQAENAVKISATRLAHLLADRQTAELVVAGSLEPVSWPSVEAKLKNEKYRLLENEKIDEQVRQLDGTRRLTLAKNWPQLGAVAAWNRSAYVKTDLLDSDATNWALGLQLTVPLFSGLSSFRERAILGSRESQLDISRAKLLDEISLSQVQTRKNIDTELSVIDSSRKALDLGEASLKEAEREFKLSTINYVQYLASQQNLLSAELSYDQARSEYVGGLNHYFVAWGYPLGDLVELLDPK